MIDHIAIFCYDRPAVLVMFVAALAVAFLACAWCWIGVLEAQEKERRQRERFERAIAGLGRAVSERNRHS